MYVHFFLDYFVVAAAYLCSCNVLVWGFEKHTACGQWADWPALFMVWILEDTAVACGAVFADLAPEDRSSHSPPNAAFGPNRVSPVKAVF